MAVETWYLKVFPLVTRHVPTCVMGEDVRGVRLAVLLLGLLLAACNLGVPQVTPTVAPSRTPSETPVVRLTSTPTNTPIVSPTPYVSPTATLTETALPTQIVQAVTLTATPTGTLTAAPTSTPTRTPFPTLTPTEPPTLTPSPAPTETPTPTETPPPSPTPLPTIGASATFTASPTPTPTPSDTPTIPPRPTDTLAPVGQAPTLTPSSPPWTLSAEDIARILTPPFTYTPAPTDTPPPISPTSPPQPTLNVQPTFIVENVLAPTPLNYTPPPALTTPQLDVTAWTPEPAQVAPTIEVGPVLQNAPTSAAPAQPVTPGTLNYTLSLTGGAVNYGVFDLQGRVGSIDVYAQNPANPNQYAVVNGAGQIFFVSDYASRIIERVPLAFLTEFHWNVSQRADNNAAVTQIAWANNGVLALIVDGDDSKDTDKDGVWYWSPSGGLFHLTGNCTSVASCIPIVNRGVSNFRAVGLRWSPDNEHLLVELILYDEGGRRAFVVVNWRTTNPDTLPEVFRYEYAHWSSDGRRVVVSGHSDPNHVVVGMMNADGSGLSLIDTAQIGVAWAQDAVEYGGNVYFLGSALGIGSPLSLYDMTGRRITGDIGDRAPERISWSPDNRAALVVVNVGNGRRYYVARVDTGSVEEISAQVANALTVEWVSGGVPNAVPTQPPAFIIPSPEASIGAPVPAPAPVSEAFAPGTQVRVLALLNFRFQPALGGEYIIRQFSAGEVLTIVSGPVEAEGYTWYEVRTQAGMTGWVASVINTVPTIERVG